MTQSSEFTHHLDSMLHYLDLYGVDVDAARDFMQGYIVDVILRLR